MRMNRQVKKTLLTATVLGAGLMLGACAPQYKNHGYIPPQEDLDQIVVGQDTRDTIATTVGVPASAGMLTNSGYYYVKSRRKSIGFLRPKEVEREVVAISFTSSGVVENVERFGLERGNVIALDRRVTSSAVSNKSFIRQLLGNIGGIGPSGLGE